MTTTSRTSRKAPDTAEAVDADVPSEAASASAEPPAAEVSQSALLAALMGGGGGGVDLASLLGAQLGTIDGAQSAGDPQQMLLRWFQQRQAASDHQAPSEDEAEEDDPELQRLDHLRQEREREERRERVRELKRVTVSLYAEVEALRTRNDRVASALGACHICFGEDVACPECAGIGLPGSLVPDATLFRQLVTPALARVREAQLQHPERWFPVARKEYRPQGDQAVPNRTM